MAIRRPQGPPDAPRLIGKAMDDLGLRGPIEARAMSASQPIPIFVLRLDEIDGEFLERAKLRGWRYLVSGRSLAADVGAENGAELDSIIHGEIPERLIAASERAMALFGERPEQFEARILEIPALYVAVLWIHGPEQTFLGLLDSSDIPPLIPIPQAEFEQRVLAAAERVRNQLPEYPDLAN